MSILLNVISKIVRELPNMQGAAGRVTLTAKQLQAYCRNPKQQELLQTLMKYCKEPTLEVGYKAKSNYSIAGLRLKDGKNVVGQGAISIANPCTNQAVIKTKMSAGKSYIDGFIDGGKPEDITDMLFNLQRKDGAINLKARIGKAMRCDAGIQEGDMLDFAKATNAESFLKSWVKANKVLSDRVGRPMVDFREAFRGEYDPYIRFAKKYSPDNDIKFVMKTDNKLSSKHER